MSVDFKRAKVKQKSYGNHRIFDSRCGNYRIIRSEITLGGDRGERYSIKWYAIKLCGGHERVISIHRKQSAAVKAIQRYDKKGMNHG